jgi:methanogenic corrinoid protein MtbC1
MNKPDSEHLKADFLENLLQGNRAVCAELTRSFMCDNPSIEAVYEDLFKQALYTVGQLWEQNKISVATEHMATAIVEGIMNGLFEELIVERRKQHSVVLACAENEKHQVGIKMVGDIFEKKGWDSYFLGAGIPTGELVRFIRQVQPDLLAISFSVYFSLPNLMNMLASLRSAFPNLLILIGGQAAPRLNPEFLPSMCEVLTNLYTLEQFIDTKFPTP